MSLFNVESFFSAFVSPVCLPALGDTIASLLTPLEKTQKVVVTGWGDTETGTRSLQLLQVSLPFVPLDVCRRAADYNSTMVNGPGQVS